jgi:hypothetical protein
MAQPNHVTFLQIWNEYLLECIDHDVKPTMDDFALYLIIRKES